MESKHPTYSHLSGDPVKLAEEKLAILSSIITASDDAIISKTLEGIITSWNPAAEKIFGYLEDDVIGQHISLIIPSDRIEEETFIIGQIKNGIRVRHFETVRLSRIGTLVPVSLSVSPVINTEGKVIGASKILHDISDRKKADEKRAILAAIVDTSDDAIISKKLTGMITSWNNAAEKMFGYTEAEVIGKHISLIIPTERLSEEQYIIAEVIKGNKVDHFQTVRQTKDGSLVPISLSVSPIIDANGNIIGASKIARDISEQLITQQEKARLYEKVKKLNDKKDEFIGFASHELKTPITSIHGYLQMLTRLAKDEQSHIFLKKASQQVKRANSLISELLDVSKIESGKLQIHTTTFDIQQLVEDVIEMISYNNQKFKISLKSAISELLITGDSSRIEQVIINLLTNAMRYSGGNEEIIVHLSQTHDEVAVGVQDYGIGIPADQLHDIFLKYFRVDNQNHNVSGLGIGLFLCQEIINLHQGRIWVESELSKGSTFWFALPI